MPEPNTAILIAVRHGETEWNVDGKQQGHLDSPLTALGVQQAEALAAGLADRKIDVIYSSDLGRALQTARIIDRRLSIGVLTEPRLRERSLGVTQGLTVAQFARSHPADAARYISTDPDYVIPGGESARQRHERCVACADELAARHAGETVLIVAHGGVLESLFRRTLNLPLAAPRRFSFFNASINTFSITHGVWRLATWGDISHLKGMDVLDDA